MIDEDQGYLQVNTPQEILEKAGKLISGPRAVQHGDYKVLHARVASMWSSFLDHPITSSDVAFCMLLLKGARSKVGGYNGVDGTAYAALWSALDEFERAGGS